MPTPMPSCAPTLLWIEAGSCSGESMALLGAEGPGRGGDDLLAFLERHGVRLLWHPSLSVESPADLLELVDAIVAGAQPLTLLCVEGSIIHGPGGSGRFDTFHERPKRDLIRLLCEHADYVLAMGTCAAYGGIPAAPPNPTESTGLQYTNEAKGGLLPAAWRSRAGLPVLNLAGCPVDATTMVRTMGAILEGELPELDRQNRPGFVGPCLSDPHAPSRKCGTSNQVGYACYGCIGARFPPSKALFRHVRREALKVVA
jgi:Ni,Fe-hydrogenase I small subunit